MNVSLIHEFPLLHSDAPHSARLLWTGDWSAAETSILHHTTLTTGIHASCGIRNRNPSKRAAADPRLRSRGHWGCIKLTLQSMVHIYYFVFTTRITLIQTLKLTAQSLINIQMLTAHSLINILMLTAQSLINILMLTAQSLINILMLHYTAFH